MTRSPPYTLGSSEIAEMGEAKHTALPWKRHSTFVYSQDGNVCATSNPRKDTVVDYYPPNVGDDGGLSEAVANAEFIIRACNAHDDLVKAAEAVLGYRTGTGYLRDTDGSRTALRRLKAALEKIGAQS